MTTCFDAKAMRERMAELKEEMKGLSETARAEERAFNNDEVSRWDKLETEFNDAKSKAETAERMERLPVEKPSMPVADKAYTGRKVTTRSDANNALRAFYAKNKSFWDDSYATAAERCQFNYRSDSFNIRLKSQSDLLERSQNIGTPADGGYSVNDTVVESFEKALKSYWNWSPFVTVRRTSDGSPIAILTSNDTTNQAGYLDELEAVSNTSLAFNRTVFNAYKLGSGVFPISNELLQDSSVDIATIVGQALGERIGRKLSAEFTNGTGSGDSHVTGFTESTTSGGLSTYYDGLSVDDLIDIYFSVDEAYRQSPSCAWMMHSSVLAELVKLADQQGRPLYGAGLNNSPQTSLMGKSVIINDNLPTAAQFAAGVKPVYFGDWSKYIVRMVRDVNIRSSNELYFKEDAVATLATVRVDGKLVDAGTHPIKHLTLNTASGAPSVGD